MKKKLSDAEIGYLAGIIDGEGHISITRHRGPRPRGHRYYALFSVQVAVTNTNPKVHEWLSERFVGTCHVHWRKKIDHARHKPSFRWRTSAKVTREMLELTLPYLVIKREQALLALKFLVLRSERVPSARTELYEQMKVLNLRGPRQTTAGGAASVEQLLGEERLS